MGPTEPKMYLYEIRVHLAIKGVAFLVIKDFLKEV